MKLIACTVLALDLALAGTLSAQTKPATATEDLRARLRRMVDQELARSVEALRGRLYAAIDEALGAKPAPAKDGSSTRATVTPWKDSERRRRLASLESRMESLRRLGADAGTLNGFESRFARLWKEAANASWWQKTLGTAVERPSRAFRYLHRLPVDRGVRIAPGGDASTYPEGLGPGDVLVGCLEEGDSWSFVVIRARNGMRAQVAWKGPGNARIPPEAAMPGSGHEASELIEGFLRGR